MTTREGRAFAQMLAVFDGMEAAATLSRITAARAHLVANGRPDRIEWVWGMVVVRACQSPVRGIASVDRHPKDAA